MNGNGYPYPMRGFPSSRPSMMDNMENDMGAFDDINMTHGQSLDQASRARLPRQNVPTDRVCRL